MKHKISRRFRPTMTPDFDQLESRNLLSTGFQVESSPTAAGLNAVAAASPTDIFAVGEQGTTTLSTLVENFLAFGKWCANLGSFHRLRRLFLD